jgi:uncharacterized membrane protein|tara:strand:- start:145 stop:1143 length:999 start_codon:yes stop_codon:yes gene_type:complete
MLHKIPVDRKLIEELYLNGKINDEARQYSLDTLNPRNEWLLWLSRLLMFIGTTLILAGIIYFFSFNWDQITSVAKLLIVELMIIVTIVCAFIFSLKEVKGQLFLFAASLFVGLFFVVLGQVYTSDSPVFLLFLYWSILIIGWTLISNFSPQWFLLIFLVNIFLITWWNQWVSPSNDIEFMIYTFLMIFNGLILSLREYFASDEKMKWLRFRWIRILLTFLILPIMLIPILTLITSVTEATFSVILSAVLGIFGHIIFYYVYRYKFKDLLVLATLAFSACIVIQVFGFEFFGNLIGGTDGILFAIMGIVALLTFSSAIIVLRKIDKGMESSNV